MLRVLFSICVIIGSSVVATGQCQAPRHRKGRDYGGSVYVSVTATDLTIESLTCLGQTLSEHRRRWKKFQVLFFTSRDAALNFQPTPIEISRVWWAQWARQLHAGYFRDTEKHEEYLQLMPLGFEDDSSSTKVVLPASGKPHCQLEVDDRCLTAVDDIIAYPKDALTAKASGSVVLTGTIKRDGRVSGLRVVETKVDGHEGEDSLVNAARQNLMRWQFDAAGSDAAIRITYSYVIDASLVGDGEPEVYWALPKGITIRASPLH